MDRIHNNKTVVLLKCLPSNVREKKNYFIFLISSTEVFLSPASKPLLFQVILDRRADPNRKNKFGMTPMQHAAVAGSAEVISCLIKAGGKANMYDDQRRMPLHWTAGSSTVGES